MKTILYNGKQVKLTPLLMKSELVSQTRKGLKTQTRRLNGLEEINLDPDRWISGEGYKFSPDNSIFYFVDKTKELTPQKITCLYGQKGDVIWVREMFGCVQGSDKFYFPSEFKDPTFFKGWKPSIHMPFDACRLFLEIIDIRPERLQEISLEDANQEGVKYYEEADVFEDYSKKDGWFGSSYFSFRSLWESINGKESWDFNPWIWRIEYKEIPKPEGVPG